MRRRESTPYRKKLIEVALPLDAINAASAREKSIRHGHPSTLHLWWSRKPLATCRAVLFASIVDDPSSRPEEFPTEEAQEQERQRLFGIIERLVLWENTNNEKVINEARAEILKATDGHPPPVLDPFCGGGSIPLEAQRLGLEAHASDLNPVAVLITKALIEIPPRFAGMPPVNPESRKKMQKKIEGQDWPGATGLAEDVRYYGKWMRDEAERQIGHLYPKAKLPDGSEATVIAWLWARTVKCPNPACGAIMPLPSKLWLSLKRKKRAWVEPLVDRNLDPPKIKFLVKSGIAQAPASPKIGRGAKFKCLACGQVPLEDYIKSEGIEGRMGVQMMAVAAEGSRERIYLPPTEEQELIAKSAKPVWRPDFPLSADRRAIWCPLYGLDTFDKLFTSRQLMALNKFGELINEVHKVVMYDSVNAGLREDCRGIAECDKGARAYADSVITYLGLTIGRSADFWCMNATWSPQPKNELVSHAFTRQALPMSWDFAEANPFSESSGNFNDNLKFVIKNIQMLPDKIVGGDAKQLDATAAITNISNPIISTDPPYYDNIGYADLFDFFYVWHRRYLGRIYPDIFSTILTPKDRELVAVPYRFNGSIEDAKQFFEKGLQNAFSNLRRVQNKQYPQTVYYAYRQTEKDCRLGLSSTGWEVMLESLLNTNHVITGTWPIKTERKSRSGSLGTNSLDSSVVLVCRPRPDDAPIGTRKEFLTTLKRELPEALRQLQKGNIAPVDMAQAAIGPGMAIFSRYSKVLEADGSPMRVRTALQLINQHLDEYLSEQEGEYDPDTRWALSWFEQYGMKEGPFGDAETLSKAKNTSVQGMVEAGILRAGAGRARLLGREEMDASWDPNTDKRLTVWEAVQHLIRILEAEGEASAADLQQKLGGLAHSARDLAYRLYSICERQGWSQEAQAYNSLVTAWPRLKELSAKKERPADRKLTDPTTFT